MTICLDLRKLNSATKYPSIETYHKIVPGGGRWAQLEPKVQIPFGDESLLITEKIDGTNGRIVLSDALPTGRKYLIGSREEFLTAQGDLIANDVLGIVTALRDTAEALAAKPGGYCDAAWVLFFEVYGKGLPAAKKYTSQGALSCRLFDIAVIPLSILEKMIKDISGWREHGGQDYLDFDMMKAVADDNKIDMVPLREDLRGVKGTRIPEGLEETLAWMKLYKRSHALIDGDVYGEVPPNWPGMSEGIVIRTPDRKKIAKLRFEDYEKTLSISKRRIITGVEEFFEQMPGH